MMRTWWWLFVLLTGCDTPMDSAYLHWDLAKKGIFSAALSNSGKYAIVSSVDTQAAQLYEMKTGKYVRHWRHANTGDEGVIAADFSADGRYALTADINTIVKWDVKTGQAMGYWTFPVKLRALALGKRGQRALLGFKDASALYFDLIKNKPLYLMQHTDIVNSVDLSDDGRFAITGSDDHTAKVWDLTNKGRLLQTWAHNNGVFSVALSTKGTYALTAAAHDQAKIWSVQSGQLVTQPGPRRSTVISARFSKDEAKIVLGFGANRLLLCDVTSGKTLQAWRMNRKNIGIPSGVSIFAVGFVGKSTVSAIASNGFAARWRFSGE